MIEEEREKEKEAGKREGKKRNNKIFKQTKPSKTRFFIIFVKIKQKLDLKCMAGQDAVVG